ncbi:hypothetical protein RRG08_011595 [Elysia crispata]|uniref:Uncharacterized protein n=1 Tax=Elysia crispata TaxID=231223 RepID=A0AAE0XPC4_9GAST|nr:hypothetical protein RRG08_011595 [Elysia crispata]
MSKTVLNRSAQQAFVPTPTSPFSIHHFLDSTHKITISMTGIRVDWTPFLTHGSCITLSLLDEIYRSVCFKKLQFSVIYVAASKGTEERLLELLLLQVHYEFCQRSSDQEHHFTNGRLKSLTPGGPLVKALAVRGATYVICGLAEVVQTVMELESITDFSWECPVAQALTQPTAGWKDPYGCQSLNQIDQRRIRVQESLTKTGADGSVTLAWLHGLELQMLTVCHLV